MKWTFFAALLVSVSAHAADLGVFVGDPAAGGSADGTYAAFKGAVGQNATAMNTYVNYTDGPAGWSDSAKYSASVIAGFNARNGTNMTPVVGLPMATSQGSAISDFNDLASGKNDPQLNAIFDAYAAKGFKQIVIRPGWEMNGDWYPWAVTPENAAAFKAAFQHIADVAHAYNNDMAVAVAWNPGYVQNASADFMSYFPGQQYVDTIGIDTYGKNSGAPSTAPLDNSTDPGTFTLKDAIALAKQTNRPLSLPETGAGAGDVEFPKNLADVITASQVPVWQMMIWDDTNGGPGNLQWTGDAASEAAWKSAFARIQAANPQTNGAFIGGTVTYNGNVPGLSIAPTAPGSSGSSGSQYYQQATAPQTTTSPTSYTNTAPAYADVSTTPLDTSGCARSTINGIAGVQPITGGSTVAPKTGYVQWYPGGTSQKDNDQ